MWLLRDIGEVENGENCPESIPVFFQTGNFPLIEAFYTSNLENRTEAGP